MPTSPSYTTTSDSILQKQGSEIQKTENLLKSSPTAYAGMADPTKNDLALEVRLKSMKAARDKAISDNLKSVWYTKSAPGENAAETTKGTMEKVMDFISMPSRGVVGAAKYLTGKSDSPDIFSAMDKNIDVDKEAWGGLLRKFGVPYAFSAPLGFALDIATDPVNWLSMGSTGLVGKTLLGAKTAGLEGAMLGLKSGTLTAASNLSRWIPGLTKQKAVINIIKEAAKEGLSSDSLQVETRILNMLKGTDKAVQGAADVSNLSKIGSVGTSLLGKVREGAYNLGKTAAKTTEEWGVKTGRGIESVLEARLKKPFYTDRIRDVLNNSPLGSKVIDLFDYNPRDWHQVDKLRQTLLNLADESGDSKIFLENFMNGGKVEEEALRNAVIKNQMQRSYATFKDPAAIIASKNRPALLKEIKKDLQEADEIIWEPNSARVSLADNYYKMLGETDLNKIMTKYRQIMKDESLNLTGVKWIDSAEKKVRGLTLKNFDGNPVKWKGNEVKYGEAVLNAYTDAIQWFKTVMLGPYSPSSMVNAAVGNMSMGHLMGFDITDKRYFTNTAKMIKLQLGGKGAIEALESLENPVISKYIKQNNSIFRGTYGIDPNELNLAKNARALLDDAMSKVDKSIRNEKDAKIAKDLFDKYEEDILKTQTQFTTSAERYRSGGVEMSPWEKSTGSVANETITPHWIETTKKIEEKAKAGSPLFKILNSTIKASKYYEIVDQGNKLGYFVKMVTDGVTARELNIISKSVNIDPAVDLLKATNKVSGSYRVGPEVYYKISPEKATEIVNVTFMNYSALPSFVKVMRKLPIVGVPFFSFPYLMTLKTAETFKHNPSAINKINFFLKELEGDPSPLEKENLKNKYFSWLKKPGIVSLSSLPFFQQYKVFLNATPMIPIFGQNMFDPSERKYSGLLPDKIANIADQAPAFKDPLGQVIKDFVILPALIRDYAPQNQFGGQLYPSNATPLEKTGYAVRTLAESMVPRGAGVLGVAGSALPDEVIQKVPSYSFRNVAEGFKGKTGVGIQSSTPPMTRGLTNLAKVFGINVIPMDTTFTEAEVKKSLKK